MTTPCDADDGGDVRRLVDEGLSKMRFATESSEAVAECVAEAVEAEVAVIAKARLDDASRRVTAASAEQRGEGGDGNDLAEAKRRRGTRKSDRIQTKGQPDA